MTSVCINCGETVTPGPEGSACPKCGSMAGYTVSKTITFQHKIEDGISKYQKQIERLQDFQEIYKGTKIYENLKLDITKFEKIIQDLQNLVPQKQDKVVVVNETVNVPEDVVKKETKTKTFTADTILVKTESKIKEGDELFDATNGEIFKELRESRLENKKLHGKNTLLAVLGIGGTFGGLLVGLFGGNFIKPIKIVFEGDHIPLIINATNTTNIVTTAINSTVIP